MIVPPRDALGSNVVIAYHHARLQTPQGVAF